MKKVKSKAHQKTLQLQKKIYRSLKSQVELILGTPPQSIQNYEKENQIDFRISKRPFKAVTKEALIKSVLKADVTFIGDFHTFNQAQKTALRIIREVTQHSLSPSKSWIIGLELVSSQFQPALDDFMQSKISLETFHERISYSEEWGFPWQNYAPIFEWAKKKGIRLLALNRPRDNLYIPEEGKDLYERDRWSAGIITDVCASYQNLGKKPKVIVLYGELHLGSRHLPFQLKKISDTYLKKPISITVIHQNIDSIYWKLASEAREVETEILQLKKNSYCVFSSTPWAKQQSILSWLDEVPHSSSNTSPNSRSSEHSSDHSAGETEHDYLSLIRSYGHGICELLKVPAPRFDDLSIYTIDQIGMLEALTANTTLLTPLETKLIHEHALNNFQLYIPKIKTAYIGTPSINRASELAGVYLWRTYHRTDSLFQKPHKSKKSQNSQKIKEDFYRLILEASFGYFCSLVFNPKRKCDLIEDHLKRLASLNAGSRSTYPSEKLARQITIQIIQTKSKPSLNLESLCQQNRYSFALMIAAKYIGQNLGKKLHQGLLLESFSIPTITEDLLKRKPLSPIPYQEQFDKWTDILADVKIPSSKYLLL